jgi:FKBP-type peptidyl-prolyl cis-trans isomerase
MFRHGTLKMPGATGNCVKECIGKAGSVTRVVLYLFAVLLSILAPVAGQEFVTLDSGLGILELAEGRGEVAAEGDIVVIELKLWLDAGGTPGELVADSEEFGKPLSFLLGTGRVLPAWNEGVTGMKAGGKRRLLVPHELGVGATGDGQLIPDNTDVIFEIELIEIR